MEWITHIRILTMGKCHIVSQLRKNNTTIQITHVEHFRDLDDCISNKSFYLHHAYYNNIKHLQNKNNPLLENAKYSSLIKTYFD